MTSTRETRAASEAKAATVREYEQHAGYCVYCRRNRPACTEGERLWRARAAAAAEVTRQRRLDQAPAPGQERLW